MGLPEKRNCVNSHSENFLSSTGLGTVSTSSLRESFFRFILVVLVPIVILLVFLYIQAQSVSASAIEADSREGSASIIGFFSDNNISDATVQFEQPLENVFLVFTISSENRMLKSETFSLNNVEKGQEITKVVFWGLEENLRPDSDNERDSYIAEFLVKQGSKILNSRKLVFSYRNPVLSSFKVIDFSADSEKASALITLTSSSDLSTGFRSVQVPEPSMIDLNLRLLSGNEVLYSENEDNIPLTDAYYKPINWPFLLDKDRNYTAILKVHSHAPDITTAYRSEFKAEEKVEIVDKDIRVDEYGASVTIIGKSQVPFDGVVKVVLTPEEGQVKVFSETADMLVSGRDDTIGIIWQGIPKGDYNIKIYAVDREGEVLDSYETALRVIEPVAEVTPVEKSPAYDFISALGVFLFMGIFLVKKRIKS